MTTPKFHVLNNVMIFALFILLSCGGDDEDNASSGGCPWNGNCSGLAPEGGYDCLGNSIVQCINGNWENVISCSSTDNSDGRSCTCKGGCGLNKTVCSFAFDVCDGQSYETCGPNATAVITDAWRCEPN